MSKQIENEKWATVKFDFTFTNDMRIEISNLGRLRTFTKIEDGKILKGAFVNGYRIANFKLFKPRNSKAEKHLAELKSEISALIKKIAPVRLKLKDKKKKDDVYEKYKRQIIRTDLAIKRLKENYRKEFSADEKKRRINYNPLLHRLVAEYFCKKNSDNKNLVIHLDYNKQHNHYSNLKWVTQEEATAHWNARPKAKSKNKIPFANRYDSSKGHKLTRGKVALIKKRFSEGKTLKGIAKQFHVSEMQLSRIKRGLNWGDVEAAR